MNGYVDEGTDSDEGGTCCLFGTVDMLVPVLGETEP